MLSWGFSPKLERYLTLQANPEGNFDLNLVLRWKALSGDVLIPRGEYSVAVNRDQSMITLHGHGSDFKIPALKRPTKAKVKQVRLVFQPSLGAATWILSVCTPPNVEWFCHLKVVNQEDEREKAKEKERLRLLRIGR